MALATAPSSRPARPDQGPMVAAWRAPGQVASSFAAVVVCLLALLADRGSADRAGPRGKHARRGRRDEEIEAARNARQQRGSATWPSYFPADSWELNNPAIWESDQTRLLFKNLRPLADGTVELKPCTLLFFPKNPRPNRPRRSSRSSCARSKARSCASTSRSCSRASICRSASSSAAA